MAMISWSRPRRSWFLGQVVEETFDHVGPTGRGWGEVDMEALVTVQPADDLLVFMDGVVIADSGPAKMNRSQCPSCAWLPRCTSCVADWSGRGCR
jgi:hypothetical protein